MVAAVAVFIAIVAPIVVVCVAPILGVPFMFVAGAAPFVRTL